MVRPTYLAAALEPHKQEILRKADRGFTIEMLKLWLQTKGVKLSAASLAKYLRQWGVTKRVHKDENFQLLLKRELDRNTQDKEILEILKSAGYEISERNLRRERVKQGCYRKCTKSRFMQVEQEFENFVRGEIQAGRMHNLGMRAAKSYCAERGYSFSRRLVGQILQKIDPEGVAARAPQCDPGKRIDPALRSGNVTTS